MKKKTFVIFSSLLTFTTALLTAAAIKHFNNVQADEANEPDVSVYFPNVYTNIPGRNDQIGLSVLIKYKNYTMLIDAGTGDEGCTTYLENYLKKQNVNKIDFLINTHPHSDHCGGIPAVIENHDIGRFYLKPVDWKKLGDDVIRYQYDDMYLAAKYKENTDGSSVKMISPNVEGYHVKIDDDSYFEIYNCTKVQDEQYVGQDFNFFSMMVKFTYKDSAIFIGGDAANLSDELIMNKIGHVDVFSLQHHGDAYPYNTQSIIDELTPTYAIANSPHFVKKDHGIDRPDLGTVSRLVNAGTDPDNILCTGIEGEMVFTSNGDSFTYVK